MRKTQASVVEAADRPRLGHSPSSEGDGTAQENHPSGLAALCAIARFHQIAADPANLAHQLGLAPSSAVSTQDLLRAAKHLGLKAKLNATRADRLALTPLPALAQLRTSDGGIRTLILAKTDGRRVLLQDPSVAGGRPTIEPLDVFIQQWTGELILITSRASLSGELAKFDFSWFIPSLIKYRKLLGEVLLISFMLQLFALVSPLFFQVVMDKVLGGGHPRLHRLCHGVGPATGVRSMPTTEGIEAASSVRAAWHGHSTGDRSSLRGQRGYRLD